MIKPILLIILIFSSFYTANAQPRGQRSFASFSIGPGVVWSRSVRFDNQYDKSDKATNFSLIPFARLRVGPLSLAGKGISVSLPTGFLRTSVAFNRIGSRYYGPEMDRRKDSWAFGFALAIPFIRMSFSKDIQSRSKGSQTSFNLGRMFFLGPLLIRPGLDFTYSDSEYINYYYGVRDHEVTSNRSKYHPGGSWSYGLSLMNTYSFSPLYSMTAIFSHKILGSRVGVSPTTRTDRVNSLILGFSMKVL